ncbi:MAG: hypothetical protein A3F72_14330 [Bacteroidetes bacterium RIFCSPLOWO2_12_FULL_35_15]|nr:MAG: hypothetical protein A3F72_14330 [Bacteroidetes bacterium RIFCSPLOWO2_12_FULL_35_15]
MKTASISELQKELNTLEPKKVLELCVRLVKHKKENKELLSYLLFDANDETLFINNLKEEIDFLFSEINNSNVYFVKKSLRKILRITNKYIKYSGSLQTDIELRIYFCSKVRSEQIPLNKSTVLSNLYDREVLKIKSTLSKLHEDIQFDFSNEVEKLSE